jgi:hypothetical protein
LPFCWLLAIFKQNGVEMKSGRKISARLVKRGEDDRSFDIEFWQSQGCTAIFAAAWQMVKQMRAFRGQNGSEPRLLRSVAALQRRER